MAIYNHRESGHVPQVVTLGEAMMVCNSLPGRPLGTGAGASLTFAGAESNLAISLCRLGHTVAWWSAVGDDVFGRSICATLRGEGVDISAVQMVKGAPTGVMFKSERGWAEPEVLYYRRDSAFSRCGPGNFAGYSWDKSQVFFVSGITPALSVDCRALWTVLIQEARAAGVQIWLDPNFRGKLWSAAEFKECLLEVLPLVDVLLPGHEEAQLLTDREDPTGMAEELWRHGAGDILLKWGSHGAYYMENGREPLFVPTQPVDRVVDAVGAGDAFAAGTLSGYLSGLSWVEALQRGHALGAMACLRQGDWEGAPRSFELEQFQQGVTGCAR